MKKNKKQNNIFKIFFILICFILILFGFYCYNRYLKKLTDDNIYKNINEIGEQNATNLNITIDNQIKFVEHMVHTIHTSNFETVEQILDEFIDSIDAYHFTRFAILDKDGNGTTSDNIKVKNYPNIQEFFNQEEVYLSENRPSTVADYQVNIYSKTFRFNNEELVLFATINTEQYVDILSRHVFHGAGGTLLVNQIGNILIDSTSLIDKDIENLFEFLTNNKEILSKKEIEQIEKMKKDMQIQEEGSFSLIIDVNKYFFSYKKLGINGWYVVTVAPNDVIGKEITIFLLISLGISILLIFIITGIYIYISVSNERKRKKLYDIAYIDHVTMLGNELYFKEEGQKILLNEESNKYAIALDINKFKALNNIHGYEFCNKILKTLGENLIKVLPKDSIVCRISNDTFAIIFLYNNSIKKILDKIFNEVSNMYIDGKNIKLNLCIGVYEISKEDKDINRVLDKTYMAHSKIKGIYDKNYYIFDETLEKKLIEEQQIEASMENALKNKEFKVFYQPKIYVKNEKIYGAEALVRWDKNGEMIPPGKFIPLFEKNKFIGKLDIYMFEQVCKDISKWNETYDFVPVISINVSKDHFVNENFIDEYVKITEKYGVDRSKIDIEITESATVDEKVDTIKVINNIKSKCFIVSIDDFGTGYSSLSMLQNIPIDIIKIDKIFIDKADLSSSNNIINYIMIIAKHLGVKTIVEGIEEKEQVKFVKNIKADIIQGYYYSKPISKDEFEKYFNEHK